MKNLFLLMLISFLGVPLFADEPAPEMQSITVAGFIYPQAYALNQTQILLTETVTAKLTEQLGDKVTDYEKMEEYAESKGLWFLTNYSTEDIIEVGEVFDTDLVLAGVLNYREEWQDLIASYFVYEMNTGEILVYHSSSGDMEMIAEDIATVVQIALNGPEDWLTEVEFRISGTYYPIDLYIDDIFQGTIYEGSPYTAMIQPERDLECSFRININGMEKELYTAYITFDYGQSYTLKFDFSGIDLLESVDQIYPFSITENSDGFMGSVSAASGQELRKNDFFGLFVCELDRKTDYRPTSGNSVKVLQYEAGFFSLDTLEDGTGTGELRLDSSYFDEWVSLQRYGFAYKLATLPFIGISLGQSYVQPLSASSHFDYYTASALSVEIPIDGMISIMAHGKLYYGLGNGVSPTIAVGAGARIYPFMFFNKFWVSAGFLAHFSEVTLVNFNIPIFAGYKFDFDPFYLELFGGADILVPSWSLFTEPGTMSLEAGVRFGFQL